MKKKILITALGTALASAFGTASATDVGNLYSSGSGKLGFGVFLDSSSRSMKQSGAWVVQELSGTIEVSPTETFTETMSFSLEDSTATEKQDHLYLKLSFAATPKIDLYGKAGVARTRIEKLKPETLKLTETETFVDNGNNFSFTEQTIYSEDWSGGSDSGKGDWGTLFGIGARLALHDSPGFMFSLDMQYQMKKAKADWSYAGIDIESSESRETQGALVFASKNGMRPYGGVKYARAETKFDADVSGFSSTLTLENENPWGAFFGMNAGSNLSFEIRAGDETALNVGWSF